MTEPALRNEPTESTEPNEPAEPIDRIEPADPTDRIEPEEPMDKMDPLEPMLRSDPAEPASRGECFPFRMRSLSQPGRGPRRRWLGCAARLTSRGVIPPVPSGGGKSAWAGAAIVRCLRLTSFPLTREGRCG